MQYPHPDKEDWEYVLDTLRSLWIERETVTKEEILGHLEEMLIDLDLLD